MPLPADLTQFLASVHPYDSLAQADLTQLAKVCESLSFEASETIFALGQDITHLYIIMEGEVEITDESGVQLSILGPRNSFGERALLRGDSTRRAATALAPTTVIVLPSTSFFALIDRHASIARFFDRRRPPRRDRRDLATMTAAQLMTNAPITCAAKTPIRDAAELMDQTGVSSLCICNRDGFQGIVTLRDMNSRVLVGGADPAAPISTIMTRDVLTLGEKALGVDVLHLMVERRVKQIPIVDHGMLQGIVTQTDLTRVQAMTAADLVGRVARAKDAEDMARATGEIPQLLVQLVGAGNRHEVVTRLITDIADTATRRLIELAEEQLGPAPVPYLWLACGSQGRQEQTGVSDQDNCLILADDVDDGDLPYFKKFASVVSTGLDTCGYFFCPGDMMASNPRWRQPLNVWREYFRTWITKPDAEAQMLASVMFDLRPIGGDISLFETLQNDTLEAASKNSIFTAHMIANSLKHHPPLGLLRGLATIRSGEHRNQLDLKHNGVVPVVDLGRVYALQGQLKPINTRARLEAAINAGALSSTGGADLLDAYDHIATTRLEMQARQIKAGEGPSNYLDPSTLSDFERSHLRDAFVVVRTMQSAAGSGKGTLG